MAPPVIHGISSEYLGEAVGEALPRLPPEKFPFPLVLTLEDQSANPHPFVEWLG